MPSRFDLQGHRGARGLKPENTLPGFEVAFDLGVTSVETDVHLTRDEVPVLIHDPAISPRLCRLAVGKAAPDPADRPLLRSLTLEQVRDYRADVNPDRGRFPEQDAAVTPAARRFAERHGVDPYAPPTLAELFLFAAAYAGELGAMVGKTEVQRGRCRVVRFDLELKRVPFRPEFIGDAFDGSSAGTLEQRVVEAVRAAGMVERTGVRSFDHRSVRCLRELQPGLATAVLVAEMVPVAPGDLARQAGAGVYCPCVEFLDEVQVRQLQAEGLRLIPWTVNDPQDWTRLLDWGVDGITTDFPDRLAGLLRERGML